MTNTHQAMESFKGIVNNSIQAVAEIIIIVSEGKIIDYLALSVISSEE